MTYATSSTPPAGFLADGTLGYLDSAPNGGARLDRYVGTARGDILLTTGSAPAGYQFEATLGYVHTGTENTSYPATPSAR